MNLFKLGLISFWSLWLLIVFMTNLFEELKLIRLLPPYWKFASQNFQAVAEATSAYHAPQWVPRLLFLGVLLWQGITLVLFWRAVVLWAIHGSSIAGAVNTAFAASLGLLAAFMIADEIFKQYDVERGHVLLFIAQLVTLLALHLLPA